MLVLYIFVKHVIFNKVVTYRLEACDFVRKCFAKMSRRKFLDNLKRATAQDPHRKISVMESFLMKLQGWTLGLQLQWKKPPPSLHELSFFDKIEVCVLQDCSFIETLVHCRFFSQRRKFSLTATFRYILHK